MSKAKLFIENFLVYGLGGIISKIIPFVMIPIITRIMPTTEYFGISDMSNTIIAFGSALAVFGMYDAMYRLFFDKEDFDYKKKICSTTFVFTLFTSIIVCLVLIIFKEQVATWFLGSNTLAYVIIISAIATLVSSTNQILSAPTRMQNKKTIFLITNTIGPLLSYAISILLLIKGYYIIAIPLASLIAGITMEVSFLLINRKWFHPKLFDFEILKQLLVIAVPLFPSFLVYWVFNSSDRLMITNLLGVGAEGVYSVGSKLGHASQLIYIAFSGGWQFFAFSTMKEEKQIESNSKVFEYLGIIAFVATAFVCSLSLIIFKLLFIGEYVDGYIIAPYLFLAPLLQMLFQVAGNQFLVIKKTWPIILILVSGALLNIILNFILIPIIGIEGAAIATLLGYVVSDFIVVAILCKMKLMVVSSRFCISTIGILLFLIFWRREAHENTLLGLLMAIMFMFLAIALYRKEIGIIIKTIKLKRKKKNN